MRHEHASLSAAPCRARATKDLLTLRPGTPRCSTSRPPTGAMISKSGKLEVWNLVCGYVYIYIYIHTHTYIYIYMYIYKRYIIYTYMYICICIFYVYKYIYLSLYMCVHICTYVCSHCSHPSLRGELGCRDRHGRPRVAGPTPVSNTNSPCNCMPGSKLRVTFLNGWCL